MTPLAPHQQRVLDEKRELDERLAKLEAFILDNPIWQTLDGDEKDRLARQARAMAQYSQVLDERIAAFSVPLELPVLDPGPDALEREIAAKATAPRVTPADIEAEIASEHYFTAREGVLGMLAADGVPPSIYEQANAAPQPLGLLTFCVLVLRNGFAVTGESACASPENFDADIGRKIARQNAVSKVWPLLGFRLRDRLART